MKIKSVFGFRLSLDDASGVSDLHRGGDLAVEASSYPRVACFGQDPRGDAVKELSRQSETLRLTISDWPLYPASDSESGRSRILFKWLSGSDRKRKSPIWYITYYITLPHPLHYIRYTLHCHIPYHIGAIHMITTTTFHVCIKLNWRHFT